MNAAESTIPVFDQHCLAVLESYARRDSAARATREEYDGWLERVVDVPGVETASLTTIHGYLIAQGLIRFEFSSRNVGLQYQLSPIGRESLNRQSLQTQDDQRSSDVDSHPESRQSAA